MRLHRIWIAIAALAGVPVAGMGLLLVVPAAMDGSPAALLLLAPTFLVVWAVALFFRLLRSARTPSVRTNLFAFYIVTGTASVWATTWDFSREGIQGQMFSPWTTLATAAFFFVPVMHLLFVQPGSEPGASPTSSRRQTRMDQSNKVTWLRIAGALVMGVLLLGALLPSTGGMIINPAPSAKMWRCGPFLLYPGPFFGILGTITVLTSFTVFGVVRRNSCEFVGWVLLGVAFLWILFA